MAKGARASSRKKSNQALRAKIFGPADHARTERLSAKLQALAAKPRPEEQRAMDVDAEETSRKEPTASSAERTNDAMDIDARAARRRPVKKNKGVKSGRIAKASHRKAKNSSVFPDIKAKWRRQAEARKKRS